MNDLKTKAKLYILLAEVAAAGLVFWNVSTYRLEHFWLILTLGTLASLALILKVEGATNRTHYNFSFVVYAFAFVTLNPLETFLVIMISNAVEWAWHRYAWYIQTFNIASFFISMQLAYLAFDFFNLNSQVGEPNNILGLVVGMLVFTLINHLTIGIVVWLARGENFIQSGVFDFLPLSIDFILLTLGLAAALLWQLTPLAVLFAVLPLYMIYTSLKVPALERKSDTDPKTGLFNVSYFNRALQTELDRANRFDRPLTVVMADLDFLRHINNTYGHLAGDVVLIGIAKILQESTREYDIVCRFGGEEFAILIPETRSAEVYEHIDKIRARIENTEFTVETSITPIHATMSFGIAERYGHSQSMTELLHSADSALYHSKLAGRNRVTVYSEEAYVNFFFSKQYPEGEAQDALLEHGPDGQTLNESDFPEIDPPSANGASSISNLTQADAHTAHTEAGSHETRSIQSGSLPSWVMQLFIGGLTLLALAWFRLLYTPISPEAWLGVLIFAVIVALTEGLSIDIYYKNTAVSTSAAPMLAGTLLYGPVGALVMSAAFAITAKIKHKSPFDRMVFNFGNQLLAAMAYLTLLNSGIIDFSTLPQLGKVIYTVVSAMIVYAITTVDVAEAISLNMGVSIRKVWKEQFSWLYPYYAALGLIAFALIFTFESEGWIGIIVLLVPLFLLRLGQMQYIQRTTEMVGELRKKNAILEERAEEITGLTDDLLNALAQVIDLHNPYVLGHSEQVTRYATLTAQKIGLGPERIELVRKASLLHDIGKLGIPDQILMKPSTLLPEERQTIQKHVLLGAKILGKAKSIKSMVPIVRHHHERFDGKGYPDKLKAQEIPLEARILAVADAVEAMASDRPYRKALSLEEIISEIRRNAGTQFDPQVVEAFIKVMHEEGENLIVNSARNPQFSQDLVAATQLQLENGV